MKWKNADVIYASIWDKERFLMFLTLQSILKFYIYKITNEQALLWNELSFKIGPK